MIYLSPNEILYFIFCLCRSYFKNLVLLEYYITNVSG